MCDKYSYLYLYSRMPVPTPNIQIHIFFRTFLVTQIYLYFYLGLFPANPIIFLFVFVVSMETKYILICIFQKTIILINYFQICALFFILKKKVFNIYNKLEILYTLLFYFYFFYFLL